MMKRAILSILPVSIVTATIPEQCIVVSSDKAGLPIGQQVSNFDILKENLTIDHRFLVALYCVSENDNQLTGLQLILEGKD